MPLDPYIARGVPSFMQDVPNALMQRRNDKMYQQRTNELARRTDVMAQDNQFAETRIQNAEQRKQQALQVDAFMSAALQDGNIIPQVLEKMEAEGKLPGDLQNWRQRSIPELQDDIQRKQVMHRAQNADVMPQKPDSNMGSLYKLDDGTYQPTNKAAGQRFYQEPERGHAPMEAPADRRLYEWYASLPPEQQQAFLNMKRSSATPEAAANIATAKTTATERAKAAVAAQADLPRVEGNAGDMLHILNQLKTHKGVRFIVGGYSMVPPVPGTPQADAYALWEQVQGKAFLEAFNTLKGGGQITEKEGEKATAAITRLSNRRQSLGGFMKAVKDLEEVISAVESRARQKAGKGGSQRLRFDANGDPVQ